MTFDIELYWKVQSLLYVNTLLYDLTYYSHLLFRVIFSSSFIIKKKRKKVLSTTSLRKFPVTCRWFFPGTPASSTIETSMSAHNLHRLTGR